MAKKSRKKTVEDALAYVKAAETMKELLDAVSELTPEERNDKTVGYPVYLATQRIVGKAVRLT